MTREEWEQIVAAINVAWPDVALGADAQATYFDVLADLPFADVRVALVTAIGQGGDELPRPGDLLRLAVGAPATPSPPAAHAPVESSGDIVISLGGGSASDEAAPPPTSQAAPGALPSGSEGMSPRMRRLLADWEAVRAEFSGHPLVSVEPLGPTPPDKYKVTFRLTGVALQGENPVHVAHHECEIHLPIGYPREQPLVLPLTPIFHPNVSDRYCIADYWSAGEGLMDVITRLAKIIQYQSYNTKSPLNARAAYWADQNPALFPIGHERLGRGDLNIQIGGSNG